MREKIGAVIPAPTNHLLHYDNVGVDGRKNPSQQRETLPIPQVPIRLMNIWCGRLDGIMDLLLSNVCLW